MNAKPRVIQAEHLDEKPAAWLAERCELIRVGKDDTNFRSELALAEGLIVRSYTPVTDELLDAAKKLRVVARAGVGLDTIDLAACKARGVRVVYTPGANTQAVVELFFALLLDVVRPRVFLHRPIPVLEAWKHARKEMTADRELASMTLGILGLGRIGSRVAEVARCFGMRVIYHDVREIPQNQRFGAEPVSREELFAQSDALTIHVDGSPSNRRLIGESEFAQMKPEVVFLNLSRGFVVDPYACASFIIEHRGACAVLDVHDPEPYDLTYPLIDIANVHMTPHIGGATKPASEAMSWVVRDVWRVLAGEEPEHEAQYP
ncbi:MAG: 3-phosphoglycerate dehydrogenase [Phycisphaera sp.]|nr:3-phosphoglycerate dehydrogenase [Phycisphaera sp.]